MGQDLSRPLGNHIKYGDVTAGWKMSKSRCLLRALVPLVVCWSSFVMPGLAADPEDERAKVLGKKETLAVIAESAATLNKAKAVLRLAGTKLPDLVSDNREFRRLDRQIEICRDDLFPALASAEKLKEEPDGLRDAVRLVVNMRVLEQHCLRLSDRLGLVQNAQAGQLATQIVDIANRVGRMNLKLQPYFYRLVDVYQSAAAEDKVDSGMHWEETASPVL